MIRRFALPLFAALVVASVGIAGVVLLSPGRTGEIPEPPESSRISGIPDPPESSLSSGERTSAGEIGSYCWRSPPSEGGCVDAAGLPVPEEALAVPAGSTLEFDYGGDDRPALVIAQAYPLDEDSEFIGGRPGERMLVLEPPQDGEPPGTELQVSAEDPAGILADLPLGDHLVEVQIEVPEGDASYYFRVLVE